MTKVIVNQQGKALLTSSNKGFYADASIDSNIQAGNIKKDVVILGVTGTYEGSGGGNPVAEENDVIFIDYDGTIRYSYSAADFANLTALPANPSHAGLTAQGWNWTLADAKEYVAAYGMLVIGQLYITDDGKTRLYVTIGSQILSRTLYWQQSAANGVVIDWGDGSATETVAGTGNKSLSHTYSSPGEYVIKLAPTEGTTMNLGNAGNTTTVFGDSRTTATYAVINSLHKVELGSGCTMIDQYTFCNYRGLEVLTVPKAVRTIRSGSLQYCPLKAIILGDTIVSGWNFVDPIYYSTAKYISIPKGINNDTGNLMYRECQYLRRICITPTATQMHQSAVYGCSNLKRIVIPSTVTTIGNTAMQNCASLEELTIPSGITTIGSKALQCQSLMKLVMLPTTPPTISSDTLTNTPAGLVIYVPNGKLATYQAESNWSAYSSQMVEMPA